MKNVLAAALSFVFAFCLCASAATPHAKIRRIWVYAHNMTDSVNFDYNLNNPRFYLDNEEGLPTDSVEYGISLSGIDSDWITPREDDWHFYSDLKPGSYTFKVRCRVKGGEWGPEYSREFTIHKPWWRTSVAIISYIIIITAIVAYIVYLVRARIKIRNQLVVERKNQQFKNELVLHASREFRAPLSIIRTTIEKLKTEDDRLSAVDIRHLRTSCRSLMLMVEQLAGYGEPSGDTASSPKDEAMDRRENNDTPVNQDIKVLVAVQHIQLAEVIKRDMQESVEVILSSGNDILRNFAENKPDALVLDTDLTDINAYKLLHKLKTDPATASVPVVLISTFDNSRSLLKAIRSEADDYIAKPFNCEVLTAVVIKNIKVARERAALPRQEEASQKTVVYERRTDKQFLARLEKTVSARLGDSSFDVNALAEALQVSRIQLYNRLKELNGKTPVEYLRERRLDKAAALLLSTDLSVKEVRDMVGMPDATNFHRRFKDKFGLSPNAYRQDKDEE